MNNNMFECIFNKISLLFKANNDEMIDILMDIQAFTRNQNIIVSENFTNENEVVILAIDALLKMVDLGDTKEFESKIQQIISMLESDKKIVGF